MNPEPSTYCCFDSERLCGADCTAHSIVREGESPCAFVRGSAALPLLLFEIKKKNADERRHAAQGGL